MHASWLRGSLRGRGLRELCGCGLGTAKVSPLKALLTILTVCVCVYESILLLHNDTGLCCCNETRGGPFQQAESVDSEASGSN